MFKNFYRFMFFSAVCIFSNIFAGEIDKSEQSELSIFSQKFERIIKNDSSKLIIQLNDGSQWFVLAEFNDDLQNCSDAFASSLDQWNKGDDIIINKNGFGVEFKPEKKFKLVKSDYVLKNVNNNQVFFVDLNYNMLEKVKNSSIKKIDRKGYFVTTENNIVWEINWVDSWLTNKWRVGDKIIIARSESIFMKKEDKFIVIKASPNIFKKYLLINLNERNSVNPKGIKWK